MRAKQQLAQISRTIWARIIWISIAVSIATLLTLMGQFWLLGEEQGRLPSIGPGLGLFWFVFMVVPAKAVALCVGWRWGDDMTLTAPQLCMALLVNDLLWGLAGAIVARFAGYLFARETKSTRM